MINATALFWFRQDLRLSDNPALYRALHENEHVIPIYILDEINTDKSYGGASKLWLHHSLNELNKALNGRLKIFKGCAFDILKQLTQEHSISKIYWNRCYEPWRIKRDKNIKEHFKTKNIECFSDNGSLLWEPWEVLKKDNTPYKVFTPYYRKGCLQREAPRTPLKAPELTNIKDLKTTLAVSLNQLELIPDKAWTKNIVNDWSFGEQAAHNILEDFIEDGLSDYKEGRNFPAKKNVSRLSPYLHFGEISPNQVWYAAEQNFKSNEQDLDTFKSELGWREFSYYLLYHFPKIPSENFQDKFNAFPWAENKSFLKAWQTGQTGYPIIDAAMRELYSTGYMHNRPRMIVGSFLVKNLLIHWHEGEKWFWDCLFDADLASNSASWQWVAGSGADAAPYFRIFNPITQSEKFDAKGEYIKKYVPELKHVPAKLIHAPWEMSIAEQQMYNVKIGKDYPAPIVDIKESRTNALAAYEKIKTKT